VDRAAPRRRPVPYRGMKKRRTWVLDTETKGTGAHMVPLDEIDDREKPKPGKMWVPPKRTPRAPEPPKPRPPRRFRVLDVVTRKLLLEDGSVRETLALLGGVERMNDVNLYVWEPDEERWRLLHIAEQRAVWDRRVPS
jgi:hypothetical protein